MKTFEDLSEIIAKQENQIAHLEQKLKEMEFLVRYYEERDRLAKHRQFGASSEKSQIDQLQFPIFNEAEATANPSISEPKLIEVEKHYRNAKRASSDRLPEDLPIEVVEHELPAEEQICPKCGEPLHTMGRETRREMKIIPAQVIIVEHVRHVYSCRNCESNDIDVPILKASMPEPVIKGSFASPEAVAHIMTQKFVMSLPLYRLEQEFKSNGIMLSRQTMANWLIRCVADWLIHIYEWLKALLLTHEVLFADETTLQVLREPGKTAQSKSYMWLYRTGGDAEHPIVLYEYQPDRRSIHPMNFLRGFSGYLHTDGCRLSN